MSKGGKQFSGWSLLGTFVLAVTLVASPARSQQDPQQPQPPPNPPKQNDNPPSPWQKPPAKPKKDTAVQSAPDQPKMDPQRAEKDVQVGEYYMHKGDLDAAMDRFQDAADSKPGYALPFRYLGELQEKKDLRKEAVKSYTRYLELDPHASDTDKIHKKIDKLYKEIENDKKK